MKEAVGRCRANIIGKVQNLVICLSSVVLMTRQQAITETSLHIWLYKAHGHSGGPVEKSMKCRFAALDCHFSVLFLMSSCLSLLITLVVQAMVISPAMAIAPTGPSTTSASNAYDLYPNGSLCVSWQKIMVPSEWQNAGICDASPGQSFVRGAPTNGSCGRNLLAVMTETGQEECVLTVPSLRSECPVGFALIGGLCAYQPQGRVGWEVGVCQIFSAGQEPVPPQWIRAGICNTNPTQNPEKFVQPSGTCQQGWTQTTTRTGQEECVLTVPSFKSECPVGFALDGGLCKYQPQDSGIWQVGFCK